MKISKLSIRDVRNHSGSEIQFNDGLNIFYGLNGSGKTSILESLAICGFSKSFLPVLDSSLISNGKDNYTVQCNAVNDLNVPYNVSVFFERGKRKKISSPAGDMLLAKDIIGEIPMVILSPDYKAITFGSPDSRRQFIDRLLSQASKIYIEELINYKRALRQRNSLLNSSKLIRHFDSKQIKPWTEIIIKSGAEIILRRIKFVEDFKQKFKDYYKEVSGSRESVELDYLPYGFENNDINVNKSEFEYKLTTLFEKNSDEEYRRGITLFGPHKDDLKIILNGGIAREFASQGQHKSLLISLKMAEFDFLFEKKQETPVVLFDDIFSELDVQRTEMVFKLVRENSAQIFITVTEHEAIGKIIGDVPECSFYEVKDGIVKRIIN